MLSYSKCKPRRIGDNNKKKMNSSEEYEHAEGSCDGYNSKCSGGGLLSLLHIYEVVLPRGRQPTGCNGAKICNGVLCNLCDYMVCRQGQSECIDTPLQLKQLKQVCSAVRGPNAVAAN
ncbi:hypothetical protein T4E_1448 [Trichinella pseudospiralis]|uniref:Uncharacterized protein n=1 Tax=Trichinella pseudospiralis TaxID=6337 RepID=A0A0V0XXZ7_TRIPS|nr:hypothetical protein T4E_1448 [Trichinella pseudospiralis]